MDGKELGEMVIPWWEGGWDLQELLEWPAGHQAVVPPCRGNCAIRMGLPKAGELFWCCLVGF